MPDTQIQTSRPPTVSKRTLRQSLGSLISLRRWKDRIQIALGPGPPSVAHWLKRWGTALAVLELGFGTATAAIGGDPGAALKIALGESSMFSTRADVAAVPLALVSWLLVPAVVGAVIAYLVEKAIKPLTAEDRRFLIEEFETELSRLRTELRGTQSIAGTLHVQNAPIVAEAGSQLEEAIREPLTDRQAWEAEGHVYELTEEQIVGIRENCRAGLLDWWPDAEPWRIEKGTEVLSPFVEEAARGSVDWSHAEVVGGELKSLFAGLVGTFVSPTTSIRSEQTAEGRQ